MPDLIRRRQKITFAQLSEVLTALGFAQKNRDEYILFRKVEPDAVIVFPPMRPSDTVSEAHLIVVRNTLTGKGIASSTELRSRLHRSASTPPVVKKAEHTTTPFTKHQKDSAKQT